MPPPRLLPQTNRPLSSALRTGDLHRPQFQARHFSSTRRNHRRITLQRKRMLAWFKGPGEAFRKPLPGSTNYINAYGKDGKLIRLTQKEQAGDESGGQDENKGVARRNVDEEGEEQKALPPENVEDLQPFPLNPYFRSPPVLSESFRQEIFKRVVKQQHTIRRVSQEMQVAMERVAAVVRLEKVKQDWLKEGKPLALNFSKRMLDMLPQTRYDAQTNRNPIHEDINDLPVHQSTLPQIFHPAPESKQFTRRDAARVFHRGLLPAEDRIPHPDMIESARDVAEAVPNAERRRKRYERWEDEERRVQEREEAARQRTESNETVVQGKRWDFRFSRVHADKAVGWRYGVPLEDRKKGHVKIPKAVG